MHSASWAEKVGANAYFVRLYSGREAQGRLDLIARWTNASGKRSGGPCSLGFRWTRRAPHVR